MAHELSRDAAFVMPHFGDSAASVHYLQAAVASVFAQTDRDWQLILVDDQSPRAVDHAVLAELGEHPRIHVLRHARRLGPGPARNLGIAHAQSLGAPFILFLDSDDLASPDRLSLTRAHFAAQPGTGVVYSPFEPIDHAGHPLPAARLAPSIQVILRTLAVNPPTGPRAWIDMATTYGYSNLTSTTAVRTPVAGSVPFPAELVSDDLHTWLRYGGFGASYACLTQVTCQYRIPDPDAGSSCRRRFGSGFYREKARVDSEALELAFGLALEGNRLDPQEIPAIRQAFRNRLAEEIASEGEHALARALTLLDPGRPAPPAIFFAPDPAASGDEGMERRRPVHLAPVAGMLEGARIA